MDYFQGITAGVISNGQVLDFYEDPDAAGIEENRARHHYVEAVAGSTFQVKVTLTPEFKFCKMKAKDAVDVDVDIDGCDDSSVYVLLTKELLQEEFFTGETVEYTFTGPNHFCMQTEQWMRSDYSFSNLILSMLGSFASVRPNKMSRRNPRSWSFRQGSSKPWENTSHCDSRQIEERPSVHPR